LGCAMPCLILKLHSIVRVHDKAVKHLEHEIKRSNSSLLHDFDGVHMHYFVVSLCPSPLRDFHRSTCLHCSLAVRFPSDHTSLLIRLSLVSLWFACQVFFNHTTRALVDCGVRIGFLELCRASQVHDGSIYPAILALGHGPRILREYRMVA
jgi:hypothetical protein